MDASPNNDESYSTIRHDELLGPIIGQRVIDVTQQDAEEFAEDLTSYVSLHFENGMTLRFPINDDGFDISTS